MGAATEGGLRLATGITTGYTEQGDPGGRPALLLLPAAVWRASLRGLLTSGPPTEAGTIRAPTLVVSGARDDLLGREQTAALVSAIPGARWIEYADAGHLVLCERP